MMPPLALAFGWRTAVAFSAARGRRPRAPDLGALPRSRRSRRRPGPRAPATGFWTVLANRDLWLVGISTLIFAGVQTVLLSFLVLYLRDVVRFRSWWRPSTWSRPRSAAWPGA